MSIKHNSLVSRCVCVSVSVSESWESREQRQSKEEFAGNGYTLEPGEGRSLTELPKAGCPLALVLWYLKKGCMHERGSPAGQFTEGVQENRSGEKRLLMPLAQIWIPWSHCCRGFNDSVSAQLLVMLLLYFPEKHLAESWALVACESPLYVYVFIL